jgi:hypothetical protein
MMNSPKRRLAACPDPPANPVGPLAAIESAGGVRIVAAHALQIVWSGKPSDSAFVLVIDDAGRHRLFQVSPLAGPYVVRG